MARQRRRDAAGYRQDACRLTMAPGTFAIFFPADAHRPSQGVGDCDKLVGKFLCEEENA